MLMYPGGSENHRRGVCADGAQQKLDTKLEQNRDPPKEGLEGSFQELEWPQPRGIFTDGSVFHAEVFLQKVAEVYGRVVTEGEGVEGEDAEGEEDTEGEGPLVKLEADLQAFVNLFARRTFVCDDGAILFRLLDYSLSSATPNDWIVKIGEVRHLRMDCLRVPALASGSSRLV